METAGTDKIICATGRRPDLSLTSDSEAADRPSILKTTAGSP
jgi:hypothetical protein